MNGIAKKLKLIYRPFLIIGICTVAGYTLLNWLVIKELKVFSPNEDIVNMWMPIALPWIPILIWLQPCIKLLNLKRKKGDLPFLYILIAGLAIAIPTVIAQSYLQTASGKLSRLDNISHIENSEATKYYALKKYYVDKSNIGVQSSFEVSGKNNEYFNMNLFLALPILNAAADTASSNCIAWYGVKYHEQISNRLEKEEKEQRFKKFAEESQSDFDRKNVNQFIYLDRIGNTDDHKEYVSAVKSNNKYANSSTTILIPVNEPFEKRNGNKLAWIFGAFGISALVWLIMIMIPKFDTEALVKLESGLKDDNTDVKDALSIFLPKSGFYITPIIIDLNILIFISMFFSGLGFISFKPTDLLTWGANYKPVTTGGEWWRLSTNTFLHGGLMHLLANMCGLLFVGIILEPLLGKVKYAIVYLATGIIASVASLYFHEPSVSIGASGAIFGLYGVFLALLLTKVFPKDFGKAFLASTLIFIGYNLLMGFAGTGIDNAAHIGGLVSGFLVGLILYPQLKHQMEEKEGLEPVEV
jgi:rhomboid protease GluP